jgi:antitoxin component HigA of HigAB toxin-antitoxin module
MLREPNPDYPQPAKFPSLVGILGGKSAVSEILNGKRPLHLNHIRKLAKKLVNIDNKLSIKSH